MQHVKRSRNLLINFDNRVIKISNDNEIVVLFSNDDQSQITQQSQRFKFQNFKRKRKFQIIFKSYIRCDLQINDAFELCSFKMSTIEISSNIFRNFVNKINDLNV